MAMPELRRYSSQLYLIKNEFFKLIVFICGYSARVTCPSHVYKKQWRLEKLTEKWRCLSILVRLWFKRYSCKTCTAIFAWRVTWNFVPIQPSPEYHEKTVVGISIDPPLIKRAMPDSPQYPLNSYLKIMWKILLFFLTWTVFNSNNVFMCTVINMPSCKWTVFFLLICSIMFSHEKR